MIRLLNAGFERLRKNKIFWVSTIFSIGLALIMIFMQYRNMKIYDDVIEVEQLLLNYSIIIGIVIAIFTSLFLGVEYSDGVIRNKISIGHKKINIYLSNLIIVTIASLFSYILYMIVVSVIGIPLFGGFTMQMSSFLKIIGCIFLTILSYSSIFTFIAMIVSNKTISAIVSIMLVFGMMMISLVCFNTLSAQEYITSGTLVDGEIKYEEVPNPNYPSESKKTICQKIVDIIPAGQTFQLAGITSPNLKALPLYSIGIFVVFTGAGIVLFKKKELK
jgi:hypothetical protein